LILKVVPFEGPYPFLLFGQGLLFPINECRKMKWIAGRCETSAAEKRLTMSKMTVSVMTLFLDRH
jgi:hypothetical protein